MPSETGTKIWKRKSAITRRGDTLVVDGKSTDMVIAIMGPTGVGKSTFINTLFGKEETVVGHELRSCTAKLQHIIRHHPLNRSRRLVIVDTPGFDDTYVDDAEILRRISVWLATSYTNDMKLAGVIYLHEISQTRMLGTTRKNLDLFRKLCGDDALSSVVLGTTKWSEVKPEVGNARLKQMEDTFWEEMIKSGSRVFKFEKTQESALDMVMYLLNKKHSPDFEALQLQEELVDLQKIIPDTDAGKELRYTLEQLCKMQKDKATEEQIQKTLTALQALKVPFSLRLKMFFGVGASNRTKDFSDTQPPWHTNSNSDDVPQAGGMFHGANDFEMDNPMFFESVTNTQITSRVTNIVNSDNSIYNHILNMDGNIAIHHYITAGASVVTAGAALAIAKSVVYKELQPTLV